jgi:hypothetical protein
MEFLTPAVFFGLSLGLIVALVAVSRPIFGLVLLVVAAVGIDYASHNLLVMATADAAILGALTLSVLREKSRSFPGESLREATRGDGFFVWLGLLGVVYTIVGASRGNDLTYLLGDAFHVLLEMSVPFFLCCIFLRRMDAKERFLRTLAYWMLILSGVILFLYVTGLIQEFPGSGMSYRGSGVWRLRVNAHYPLYPLVWLIGVWFFQDRGRDKRITSLSILALTLVTILTLKRTLWVGFVSVLVFYMLTIGLRHQIRTVQTLMTTAVVTFAIGAVLVPSQFLSARAEFEAYTHSIEKRFSSRESDIDVSVRSRIVQLQDAIELIARNPLGYGLGNEAQIRFTAAGTRQPIHYVHNAFIHYALLMGLWYPILLVLLSIRVVLEGLRVFRKLPDGHLKGGVLGAVGVYVSILITSLSEIGTNTFFLPFSAAFIFLSARHIPRREDKTPDLRIEASSPR